MIKKLFKNDYALSALVKIFLAAISFVSTIIINRSLGPELRGEYTVILNTINIAMIIGNFGLYQSYPFFKKHKNTPKLKEKFLSTFSVIGLFYVLIAILFSVYQFFYGSSILILAAFIIVVMAIEQQFSFVAVIDDFKVRLILNVCKQSIFLAGLIGLFYIPEIKYLLLLILIRDLFSLFYMHFFRDIKISFSHFSLHQLKQQVYFGFLPFLTILIAQLQLFSDVILLEHFNSDKIQIGLYSAAASLLQMAWIIPDGFKMVLFSKSANHQSKSDILKPIYISIAIMAVIWFGNFLIGDWAIQLIYGSHFAGVSHYFSLLLIGSVGLTLFKLINPTFISNNWNSTSLAILSFSFAIQFSLNYLYIPKFGVITAAYTSIISYSICSLLILLTFYLRSRDND